MNAIKKENTILEALIESELSAGETYRLALETIGARGEAGALRRIEAEHHQAARLLRERCRCGAPVSKGSWSLWTGAAEEPFPPPTDARTAVAALKAGEEAEIREYELALENPDLGEKCRRLIATQLLPQTYEHLLMLDRAARR